MLCRSRCARPGLKQGNAHHRAYILEISDRQEIKFTMLNGYAMPIPTSILSLLSTAVCICIAWLCAKQCRGSFVTISKRICKYRLISCLLRARSSVASALLIRYGKSAWKPEQIHPYTAVLCLLVHIAVMKILFSSYTYGLSMGRRLNSGIRLLL